MEKEIRKLEARIRRLEARGRGVCAETLDEIASLLAQCESEVSSIYYELRDLEEQGNKKAIAFMKDVEKIVKAATRLEGQANKLSSVATSLDKMV